MGDGQLRPVRDDEHALDGTGELTAYADILDVVTHLRVLVRDKRRRLKLSLAAAGELMEVNPSTVHRFERGKGCYSDALISMLRFIAEPDTETRARHAS